MTTLFSRQNERIGKGVTNEVMRDDFRGRVFSWIAASFCSRLRLFAVSLFLRGFLLLHFPFCFAFFPFSSYRRILKHNLLEQNQ